MIVTYSGFSAHDRGMSNLIRFRNADGGLAPGDGVYMVAGSFDPLSVRATSLLPSGEFQTAVIFNYEDSSNSAMGRHHVALMRKDMKQKRIANIHVIDCHFNDPFAITHALKTLVAGGTVQFPVTSVTIDATCFSKLHLLLLLQYIEDECGTLEIKVLYTEGQQYFTPPEGRPIYGTLRTVYLPYRPFIHRSMGAGLVAFLGYDRFRLELIVHELEPSRLVAILGNPSYSNNMRDYSRHINQTLIHRSSYDQRYRVIEAPTDDVLKSRDILLGEISRLCDDGCDTIYLAALGTKVQALGIHLLRRSEPKVRLLLAHSIPQYRNLYSHGIGSTYLCDLSVS